jgi:hypothetical protein
MPMLQIAEYNLFPWWLRTEHHPGKISIWLGMEAPTALARLFTAFMHRQTIPCQILDPVGAFVGQAYVAEYGVTPRSEGTWEHRLVLRDAASFPSPAVGA